MKVGTDGVILGAWCQPGTAQRILDIGCGTGLLSLMLAQRTEALIDAVEINKEAAEETTHNVANSAWPAQIRVHHSSIQDWSQQFTEPPYELIICNPPFFRENSVPTARTIARQQEKLDYPTLFQAATQLLKSKGTFALVVPYADEKQIENLSVDHELYLHKRMRVRGNHKSPLKRSFMQLNRQKAPVVETELAIEPYSRHEYSEEYILLLSDYLTIFK